MAKRRRNEWMSEWVSGWLIDWVGRLVGPRRHSKYNHAVIKWSKGEGKSWNMWRFGLLWTINFLFPFIDCMYNCLRDCALYCMLFSYFSYHLSSFRCVANFEDVKEFKESVRLWAYMRCRPSFSPEDVHTSPTILDPSIFFSFFVGFSCSKKLLLRKENLVELPLYVVDSSAMLDL